MAHKMASAAYISENIVSMHTIIRRIRVNETWVVYLKVHERVLGEEDINISEEDCEPSLQRFKQHVDPYQHLVQKLATPIDARIIGFLHFTVLEARQWRHWVLPQRLASSVSESDEQEVLDVVTLETSLVEVDHHVDVTGVDGRQNDEFVGTRSAAHRSYKLVTFWC